MADKTPRGEQEQTTPAAADPGAPETTPQSALHESKEAGTGGSYVAPGGAAAEGKTSEPKAAAAAKKPAGKFDDLEDDIPF